MNHRATGCSAIVLCLVALIAAAPVAAAEERPTERASPAPEVNPNAVVWRTPAPPASPQAGDVWVNSRDGMEMVYVPPGEFILGTSDAEIDAWLKEHPSDKREWLTDEQPQRRIHLDGFWIDRYEVTVGQYRKFCQATGRKMPNVPAWDWRDDRPMVLVTWTDAAAYAKWAGKRLPTEAEWEKAARGTDGRIYPWGNTWDGGRCANRSNSKSTKPVGSYPSGASPYGVLDMAGNAQEWCADWYDSHYYGSAPSSNPKGPGAGNARVLRGGSWMHVEPWGFLAACRYVYMVPDARTNIVGFRCARGPA